MVPSGVLLLVCRDLDLGLEHDAASELGPSDASHYWRPTDKRIPPDVLKS